MNIISIDRLDGIRGNSIHKIYEILKRCSNGQRLLICLLFMSDMPDECHKLSDIENALRGIFPPTIREGKKPEDFMDFQASAIRFYFNSETKDVNRNLTSQLKRLWVRVGRGCWRNTDLGNEHALRIMYEKGWLLKVGDEVLKPNESVISDVSRKFLEEDLADKLKTRTKELSDVERDKEIAERFLTHEGRKIPEFPKINFSHLPHKTSPSFLIDGKVEGMAQLFGHVTTKNPKSPWMNIFPEAKFGPFIAALERNGINHIEQLKDINLYVFLNENEVFYGSQRYCLLEELSEKVGAIVMPTETLEIDALETITQPDDNTNATETFDMEEEIQDICIRINNFLKSNGLTPATATEISEELKLGKRMGISKILSKLPWCVEIDLGKHIHRDSITDLDAAAETMLQAFKRLFQKDNGYTSLYQFYNAVRADLDIFMFDNDFETKEKIFAISKHLFAKECYMGNSYVFYNNYHVWEREPNYHKSLTGLLVKLARENSGVINRALCEDYLDRIGASYPTVAYVMQIGQDSIFWQCGNEKYILSEYIHIDEQWEKSLANALHELMYDLDYFVIRDIADNWFEILPELPHNEKWTPLLLQEAIKHVPLGYKTIPIGEGQNMDTIHAAITKEDSGLDTFADVVWDYVAQTQGVPTQMGIEQLRKLLINAGMITANILVYTLYKVLEDYRFIWLEGNKTVKITKG